MNDGSDYGKKRIVSAREIAFTALFMALNIVLGLFPVPVGVATLYLTDVAICIAGMVLSPFVFFGDDSLPDNLLRGTAFCKYES